MWLYLLQSVMDLIADGTLSTGCSDVWPMLLWLQRIVARTILIPEAGIA